MDFLEHGSRKYEKPDTDSVKQIAVLVFVMVIVFGCFIFFSIGDINLWNDKVYSKPYGTYRFEIEKTIMEQDWYIDRVLERRETMRVRARDYPTWTPSFPRKKKEE